MISLERWRGLPLRGFLSFAAAFLGACLVSGALFTLRTLLQPSPPQGGDWALLFFAAFTVSLILSLPFVAILFVVLASLNLIRGWILVFAGFVIGAGSSSA